MSARSPIPFRGFDERREVRIYYRGILPHWRQDECTYFVTWRQADSLPEPVLKALEYERRLWLRNHGLNAEDVNLANSFARLSKSERRQYERRVSTKLNDFLDAGHGSFRLSDPRIARIVAQSLDHFHGERVMTGDLVIMPNHVHVLMTPLDGFELEDLLHSIKSFTANQINHSLGQTGEFWQRESYDHIVRDFDQLDAFQRYIAANPAKAKLRSDQYIHATARYCPDES